MEIELSSVWHTEQNVEPPGGLDLSHTSRTKVNELK